MTRDSPTATAGCLYLMVTIVSEMLRASPIFCVLQLSVSILSVLRKVGPRASVNIGAVVHWTLLWS
jgi:hypothetical protein